MDAELIRRTRRASKLTQESLSEDICTQETLARIENGNQQPRSEKLWQIMEKWIEMEKELRQEFR